MKMITALLQNYSESEVSLMLKTFIVVVVVFVVIVFYFVYIALDKAIVPTKTCQYFSYFATRMCVAAFLKDDSLR